MWSSTCVDETESSGLVAMKTDFLRYAGIPVLAVVSLFSGAVQVYAEPKVTTALPPPSMPLGEHAVTNNTLVPQVILYEEEPSNPEGRRASGSVVWSTETKSSDSTKYAA